jgi:hypothetical protein
MAPSAGPIIPSRLKGNHMPILLWLVGIPIPLIILILLLR